MDEGQRRSVLFREVNERIREVSARWETPGTAGFVCECQHAECSERLDVTVDEYDALRGPNGAFVVVVGHAPTGSADAREDRRPASVPTAFAFAPAA